MIAATPLGTPLEAHERLLARLRRDGLALTLEGLEAAPEANFVPDELQHRHFLAEAILDSYPPHPETGEPMGVTDSDAAMARALYSGVPVAPAPTLADALKLYIADKLTPKDTKKRQRVERVIRYATTALGGDVKLTEIKRAGAIKVRTYLLGRPDNTPATAKRNLAGIKAVVGHANWTHQLGLDDLFKGVAVKVLGQQREQRRSLTEDEVDAIRLRLTTHTNRGSELRLVWTLLEYTGCRIAEISGLEKSDVLLDGVAIPDLVLRHRESRRLKNDASERDLPLVPAAVEALREALGHSGRGLHLFPRYAAKSDTLSAALMRHVRAVTPDPKATVHSLRHLLKDRMAEAGVAFEVQEMVLGHRIPGEAGTYGSAHLRQMAAGLAQTFSAVATASGKGSAQQPP